MSGDCLSIALSTAQESAREAEVGVGVADLADRLAGDVLDVDVGLVEISPETTTRPVFTSVSQATRPVGSSRRTASSTPSEIWSATLSGWPSVTDSEVNRYSLSLSWVIVLGTSRVRGQARAKLTTWGRREAGQASGCHGVRLLSGSGIPVAAALAPPAPCARRSR